MTSINIRLFKNCAAIAAVGEGLLARTLPRVDWTHEAHLASCLWLLRTRSNIDVARELPEIIARYNESVGGVNDDSQGYHESITQFYVAVVWAFLRKRDPAEVLVNLVNALLVSPLGDRALPMRFYSSELLFSVAARRKFIAPDLRALSELDNLA
jgi:hypothetical protein